MFLYKRKNGFYYVHYELDGKRKAVSTKCTKKSDALKFVSTFNKRLRERIEQGFEATSLKKLIWEFLKHSEKVHTEKTTKSFNVTFKRFRKYIGNPMLHNISSKKLNEYIEYRRINPSVHQARKDYINLSSAFNWAITQGLLLKNPCETVAKPKPPEKLPKFYTKEEFSELLKVITDFEFRALVTFAVNTGLRQMELLELRWKQVNLAEKLIILDNQKHITKGKKIRSIPLNEASIKILNDLRAVKNGAKSYVFQFAEINNRWRYVQNNMRKYVIKAGIDTTLNFHTLRATFASWMVQSGVPIYQVSKLLGHSDIKTTLVYAHLRQDDLINAVNTINYKED